MIRSPTDVAAKHQALGLDYHAADDIAASRPGGSAMFVKPAKCTLLCCPAVFVDRKKIRLFERLHRVTVRMHRILDVTAADEISNEERFRKRTCGPGNRGVGGSRQSAFRRQDNVRLFARSGRGLTRFPLELAEDVEFLYGGSLTEIFEDSGTPGTRLDIDQVPEDRYEVKANGWPIAGDLARVDLPTFVMDAVVSEVSSRILPPAWRCTRERWHWAEGRRSFADPPVPARPLWLLGW